MYHMPPCWWSQDYLPQWEHHRVDRFINDKVSTPHCPSWECPLLPRNDLGLLYIGTSKDYHGGCTGRVRSYLTSCHSCIGESSIEFHSRVVKLLYLAQHVRPNSLTPIAFLSTRTRAPTDDDQRKLERVLRYLNIILEPMRWASSSNQRKISRCLIMQMPLTVYMQMVRVTPDCTSL